MSKCPWPHNAVRITFCSPDSVQRLASSITEAQRVRRLRRRDDALSPGEGDRGREALPLLPGLRLEVVELVHVLDNSGDMPW